MLEAQRRSALAHRPLSTLVDFKTFDTYARALVHSRDVDPVYCLVPQIIAREGFEADWFVFVYAAYYSLASAVAVCRKVPSASAFEPGYFARELSGVRAFGVERRGKQRAQTSLAKAFAAYRERQRDLLRCAASGSHASFQAALRVLPFQGDWAAFKLCELHEKALGRANLAPGDMGLAARDVNSSRGPQGGCRALYSLDPATRYGREIAEQWEALGRTLAARYGFDLGEVETCLCKWAKVLKGQYFIGHDIHELGALAPLWPKKTFISLMARAGFDRRLWAEPIDVRRARGAFAREGILLNSAYAKRTRRPACLV